MKTKRILSACLSAALLIGCLSGCNKPEDDLKPEETTPQYAYKAEYLPMTTHTGETLQYIQGFCISGDKVYFSGNYQDGMIAATDEITGEPILDEATGEQLEYENYVDGIFVLDTQTKEISVFDAYEPTPVPEGLKGNSGIGALIAGDDDTIWIYEEQYTYSFDLPENFDPQTQDAYEFYVPGENAKILNQYRADGTKLQTISIQAEEDVYFGQIHILSDGRILSYDWQNLYLFDSTGVLQKTIPCENGGQITALGSERIVMTTYNPEKQGQYLMELDLEQGKFVEVHALPVNVYDLYSAAEDFEYIYRSNDTMFGMKKDAAEGEKLFSWMECDVDSNNLEHITFLDNGKIAALERIHSSNGANHSLILMEQVDASTLPQKQELVLGCMYLDYHLRTMIVEFNRAHDDVRIVVKDYSEYMQDGTYEDALQKLNTEILSGSMPDLLCTNNLPVERYAAKGLLVDLWPMIDGDGELSRDDLMTHLFEVLSDDGKLYQVADSFNIQTAACNGSVAQGRTSWTLEEMLEALNSLQPGAGIFGETDTKADMLTQCLSYNLNNFMDWNTGTCSFDSQAFIDILNFANSFPDEAPANYDWETAESEYSRLMTGKQLMNTIYLGSFEEIQVQAAYHGGDVAFIGFPTSGSGSGSCFTLNTAMAISATCAAPDAAWAFVRQLLLEGERR